MLFFYFDSLLFLGPISGKGDEESIGNHNAVKQAITGTTNKQTNIGKGFKPSSNGKAKDNSNIERNQHQQSQQRLVSICCCLCLFLAFLLSCFLLIV